MSHRLLQVTLFLSVTVFAVGCSSMGKSLKSFVGGDEKPAQPTDNSTGLDKDNMRDVPQRHYGHMTRQKFEEDAQLGSQAGSLWSPEGQGAYLFSENTSRMMGDLLNVKLDGAPREQLQAKAKIIHKLLKKIDANSARAPAAVAAGAKPGDAAKPADGAAPAQPAAAPGATAAAPGAAGAPPPEEMEGDDEKPLSVEVIPTRVVERLNDGNYRVEGAQSFMIGKREYRLVVAGVVRAQDFSDDGVNATRLLDPHLDIVSAKKGGK
jgi:flagellar L-ring protein precursor FlgH